MTTPLAARRPILPMALLAALTLLVGCAGDPAYRGDAATPSYRVTLSIPRPVVGETTADIRIAGPDGSPVAVDDVQVSPVMTEMGHSAEPQVARTADGPGDYRVTGPLFFMTGSWEVGVAVTRAGATESADFRVDVVP